ncbi:acyl-CoA thioesterase [Rhodococcus triatomae]|uniref:Acyl-CoA thioester hydrolase n=1 Tax=Rhodococcus triatomae TaxID=300028 RepID=A0A1G8DVJ0_9NOCA|nr:acyl-CoA thioesterase [Rhodococcus triatomae]QNG18341.1 acyl-CoA thioesterase [Rhodococcus triatomae]QNG21989.1 acyl-CoA thioesterase [Rhodococcus triatomae]SDH61470.1 acyl-CoA thioester hydrolase [Rhodococcus triatomae]
MYEAQVQVRWGDSDRLGHVNNTRFIEYMQEARIQFFTHAFSGAEGDERPRASVVRKMDVEFLVPVTDDSGPLTVEVSVLHVGTSSYTLRHVVKSRDGVTCGFGDAVLVAFDRRTETSRPLGANERAVLESHLDTAVAH